MLYDCCFQARHLQINLMTSQTCMLLDEPPVDYLLVMHVRVLDASQRGVLNHAAAVLQLQLASASCG